MAELINVKELVDSLNRFKRDNTQTVDALYVAERLQEWCNKFTRPIKPGVAVHVTFGSVSIQVGDICVWDSENDGEEYLDELWCIERYKREISDDAAWEKA